MPRFARLCALAALAAAPGPGCDRGLVRLERSSEDALARARFDARGTDPADAGDPAADGPCDPIHWLDDVPAPPNGWTVLRSPVRPFEHFDGRPVGLVGRVFRKDGRCVVVAAGRPEDPKLVPRALKAEKDVVRRRTTDGATYTRIAERARQATVWVVRGGRLLLIRAYGTTDVEALVPFLDAAGIVPLPDEPDRRRRNDPPAAAADASVAPAACPPGNPLPDAYADETFWAPPPECFSP